MLDKTLVVCMGEFGRTPKINANKGRDHYPRAWSMMLAGGGIQGGRVIGATDKDGVEVKERPGDGARPLRDRLQRPGRRPQEEERVAPGPPIALSDNGVAVKELLS
jgi:hypothetical protein